MAVLCLTCIRAAQSRRDDLQSLSYTLLQLVRGSLPWERLSGGTKRHLNMRIREKKRTWTAERLCAEHTELEGFVKHCLYLDWDDKPDYDYLRRELTGIMERHGWDPNSPYDWEEPHWTGSCFLRRTALTYNGIDTCAIATHKPYIPRTKTLAHPSPPVKRGDLILLRYLPLDSLEFKRGPIYGNRTHASDPSYLPHPPLPGNKEDWVFPYRPGLVCEVTPWKDDRDFFIIRVFPLMKREDGLARVAEERRAAFKPLPLPNDSPLKDVLKDVFAYRTVVGSTFDIAYPNAVSPEPSAKLILCASLISPQPQDQPVFHSLPDSEMTILENSLNSARVNAAIFPDDDDETQAVYDGLKRTRHLLSRSVADIQPLSANTQANCDVDMNSAAGWLKDLLATNCVDRDDEPDRFGSLRFFLEGRTA